MMIIETYLRICGIAEESIVDGPGVRFTIFTQGCPHGCPGCHNPQTHPEDGGTLIETNRLVEEIVRNPLLAGVTFSGGEPFCHAGVLADLAVKLHQHGLNIITYSGYTYERLTAGADGANHWKELLDETDYLIDGPFLIEQRSLRLKFRGSENQRVIDMGATRQAGVVITTEF